MHIEYDDEADAVYIHMTDEPVESTHVIDDGRFVHCGPSGRVRGLEFLWVSDGIRLGGLPLDVQPVALNLMKAGLPVADAGSIGLQPVNCPIDSQSS